MRTRLAGLGLRLTSTESSAYVNARFYHLSNVNGSGSSQTCHSQEHCDNDNTSTPRRKCPFLDCCSLAGPGTGVFCPSRGLSSFCHIHGFRLQSVLVIMQKPCFVVALDIVPFRHQRKYCSKGTSMHRRSSRQRWSWDMQ